jgi:hypothetical protein
VAFPAGSIRTKPPLVVLNGAGGVCGIRKPKKILPLVSAVIGVLTKIVLLKAAALLV